MFLTTKDAFDSDAILQEKVYYPSDGKKFT